MYDFLIIGSGLFGSTFARKAKEAGKKCLVIEKRPHLGGNIYCENIEGITVHKYGPHIFHTNSKEVWDFVNSFVEFNRFTLSPIARFHEEIYNLPFNMNTFHQMWGITTPQEAIEVIESQRFKGIPGNLEEQALSLVGKDIYEKLIKGYTEKQWGRSCIDLPTFIIKRLPVRFQYDNSYFNDRYQGIPIGGYNKLINGLLEDIECRTSVNFFENREELSSLASKIIYTGPLDQYYDYCFGKLSWRTVKFDTEVLRVENYQGNAIVNYTSRDIPYTRIIEHKHFENSPKFPEVTVISREYPLESREGLEPYYPVNTEENNKIANQYKDLISKETKVIFGGRLAEYKYYDMAPVIEEALKLSRLLL